MIEQDVTTLDVVRHLEPFGWPIADGYAAANEVRHLVDPVDSQAGDRTAVREQGWPLVAHAGARCGAHAHQSILGKPAWFEPELLAQGTHQPGVAEHTVSDVVREQQPVFACRLGVEKTVEARRALDPHTRHG